MDDGSKRTLEPYRCCVFPAFSYSSDIWLSPIGVHRETVGGAMAVKEFGARMFGQGTNPAGIIKLPPIRNDGHKQTLRDELKKYEGLGHSHRIMLLEDSMDFKRVGLPAEDAQYIESRKFDLSEIARIYSVPLHMLQDHEKSTSWGSGIEEMSLGYVTYTLQPYLTMWEQELRKKLFDDETHYPEFLLNALLRGKTVDRYNAYNTARNMGSITANEIREMEGLNPVDGEYGDMFVLPVNLQKAEFAAKDLDTQGQGGGGVDQTDDDDDGGDNDE